MTRPADLTRQALIAAATDVFAESGFAGGSVRLITRKAKANQAAITYHFGGKEGLYQAVLKAALAAFDEHALLDEHAAATLPREEALRLFLRQGLRPMTRRDRFSRYLKIFAWESVSPSDAFRAFIAGERLPVVVLADAIVRRYLPPEADAETVTTAMVWLVSQPSAFTRNAALLAGPPANLAIDEAFVDRLIDRLTTLLHGALAAGEAAFSASPAAGSPQNATSG
jgi:TetR/AcrR family transcriptional regulator, regulator of cefoperazone and chloramphenicol sensitivity